jgi:glycosyltransferase involved in cell wall biosynthesis
MTPSPLISIIIPCFNAAQYLQISLHSVLEQDYTNKELLIIDGGSTDGSLELIEKYASDYSFVKYVSEKDKGVYDAMNKGVAMALGEWIYILGADDRLAGSSVLSDVFNSTNTLTADFIYGNVQFLYSGQIYNGEFNLFRILFGGNICHQAIFCRKKLFDVIGNFDTACRTYADHDFNIRCFMKRSVKKVYTKKVIAVYNERDGLSAVQKTDPVFRAKQAQYIKKYYLRPGPFLKRTFFLSKQGIKKLLPG